MSKKKKDYEEAETESRTRSLQRRAEEKLRAQGHTNEEVALAQTILDITGYIPAEEEEEANEDQPQDA